MSDDHDEHRDEDENPSVQRRRRLTMAASIALRKSIDGPQHGADGEAVTTKNLRALLVKTSAANVSSLRAC